MSATPQHDIDGNDHIHVLHEEDGYGLAYWNHESGVGLLEFDSDRDVYSEVMVYEDELEKVAEVLLENAE